MHQVALCRKTANKGNFVWPKCLPVAFVEKLDGFLNFAMFSICSNHGIPNGYIFFGSSVKQSLGMLQATTLAIHVD